MKKNYYNIFQTIVAIAGAIAGVGGLVVDREEQKRRDRELSTIDRYLNEKAKENKKEEKES